MKPDDADYLKVRQRRHVEMLVVSAIIVAASLILQVHGSESVLVRGWGLQLPPLCMSWALFEIRCPGCGLTRSFVLLAGGQWEESLAMHRVGWVLALSVLLQFPYRLAGLFGGPRLRPDPLGRIFPRLFGYALIGALLGNWLLEQICGRACC